MLIVQNYTKVLQFASHLDLWLSFTAFYFSWNFKLPYFPWPPCYWFMQQLCLSCNQSWLLIAHSCPLFQKIAFGLMEVASSGSLILLTQACSWLTDWHGAIDQLTSPGGPHSGAIWFLSPCEVSAQLLFSWATYLLSFLLSMHCFHYPSSPKCTSSINHLWKHPHLRLWYVID